MVNEVNAAVNGKDATIHDVDVLRNFVVFYGKEKEKQKICKYFVFRTVYFLKCESRTKKITLTKFVRENNHMRVFIGQSNELFGVSTNCYSLIRRKEISRQEKLIKDCQEHSSISTFFAKVID